MKMIILFLTCSDEVEADKISDSLLKKHLIVCAKKTSVSSAYFWKGNIDKSKETLLIMESIEDKFEEIESEVRKLHSYETFVLSAIPVLKASTGVTVWLKDGLKG